MPSDMGPGHITQIKAGLVLWPLEPESHFLFLPPPRCLWGDGKKSLNPKEHTLIMSKFFLGGRKQAERGHMLCSRSPRVSWAEVRFGWWQLSPLMFLRLSVEPLCVEEPPADTGPAKGRPAYHRVTGSGCSNTASAACCKELSK